MRIAAERARGARKAWGAVTRVLVLLWLAMTLLFGALVLMRGNPVSLYMDPRLDASQQAALAAAYGYDRTPGAQYLAYLGNLVRGELGISFLFKRPVADILPRRLAASCGLGLAVYACAALGTTLLLMGLDSRRTPLVRRLSGGLHLLSLSLPSFVVGTVLLGWLGVRLKWFPLTGSRDLFAPQAVTLAALLDLLRHMVLPVISLAVPITGQMTAYLQARLVDLDHAPFVLAARGRGVSEARIFWNHKCRTLLPALIQMAGLYLPTVAAGALVIETVFGWSGMGTLLFDAVTSRDYPLLLGGSMVTMFLVITGYGAADFLRARAGGRQVDT